MSRFQGRPQARSVMGGLSRVKPQGEFGTKLQPGASLDVEITLVKTDKSRRDGSILHIVEYDVCPNSTSREDPPGAKRSWVQNMSKENVALPAVKSFYHAILGATGNEPFQDWLDQGDLLDLIWFYSYDDSNPFGTGRDGCGYFVHVKTEDTKTQAGFDFLKHMFSPFDYAAIGWPVPNFEPIYQAAQTYGQQGQSSGQGGYRR